MLLSFFEAATFFAVGLALHILLCRFTGQNRFMLKSLVLGLLIGILLLIYQYQYRKLDIVSLYLFTALWFSYLICFINLLNSVTLRMLDDIANSPSMKLHYNDFDFYFSEEDALESRIKAMEVNNFITRDRDVVKIEIKGSMLATIIIIIRKTFAISEVG